MFDPTHIGNVPFDAIKYYEDAKCFGHNAVFCIINLQNVDHAVVLKENKSGIADQLVIDRMKFMCGLEPLYTVMLRIPMLIINEDSDSDSDSEEIRNLSDNDSDNDIEDKEYSKEFQNIYGLEDIIDDNNDDINIKRNNNSLRPGPNTEYLMFKANFTKNQITKLPNLPPGKLVNFIDDVKLMDYDEEFRGYDEFRIELYKIIVFHWLVGFNCTANNIIVRNGLPMAINDRNLCQGGPDKNFIKEIFGDLVDEERLKKKDTQTLANKASYLMSRFSNIFEGGFEHETGHNNNNDNSDNNDNDEIKVSTDSLRFDNEENRKTIELLREAINEVTGHFDFDNMRGCLLSTRQEETDLSHKRPVLRISDVAKNIAIEIEERLDFMTVCAADNEQGRNSFLKTETIDHFLYHLLTSKFIDE